MLQYYVLAGTGSVNAIRADQQRSTYAPNATYNGSLIVTAGSNGAPSCTHFQAYIDLTTGELMAEVTPTHPPPPPPPSCGNVFLLCKCLLENILPPN